MEIGFYSNIFCDFEKGLIYKRNKTEWIKYGDKNIKSLYYRIWLNGKYEKLHRVIYSYYYSIPLNKLSEIDHINQNKKDNRIENLRETTRSENQLNKNKYKNNKSGYKNIHFHKNNKSWCFKITINNKKNEKQFKTIDEAIECRNEFYNSNPEVKFGNN